jgi:hypothetical protein
MHFCETFTIGSWYWCAVLIGGGRSDTNGWPWESLGDAVWKTFHWYPWTDANGRLHTYVGYSCM